LQQCLAVVRPRGKIVLVGMPGVLKVDLAPLWQREIELRGAYAYGIEDRPEGPRVTFDLALELVRDARLERLVSARYPLERYEDAVAHAASAGRRGAVKIVFDLRKAGAGSGGPGTEQVGGPQAARTTKEAK
jgi:threonine dehydrogenase-like Zn-dependent dehydrogenase